MDTRFDSTDRATGDFVRFALGFVAFMLSAGGMILGSAPTAVTGGVVLVLCVLSFARKSG